MTTKITKCFIEYKGWRTNAFAFLPDPSAEIKKTICLLSHGYTSHKGSILTWATKLSDEGVPCLLFDQPGHYLGSFNEVNNFDDYKHFAHELYSSAYHLLEKIFRDNYPLYEDYLDDKEFSIVLAGHSLSALLSIKALNNECFAHKNVRAVCVGLGLNQQSKTHIFQTPFYKSTLNLRGQLVSPALCPDNVFPWIGEQKENLSVLNKKVHFITGEDDIVVGQYGTEAIIKSLEARNYITFDKPTKLPHHQPEMAASYIKRYFKSEKLI